MIVQSRFRPMHWIVGLAGLIVCGWLAGFIWFAYESMRPAPPIPQADGIVVLTGGAGRIDAALDLLQQGRARVMLVSGVAEGLSLDDVLHAARRDPARFPPGSIVLGHAATTTIGNALETAAWARSNGLETLIVVTAGYHMRRALSEIGSALPEATLIPYPVRPPALTHPGLNTIKLLAAEYTKWLLVEFGLTGSNHLRELA